MTFARLNTFALALVIEGGLGYAFSNIYRSTTPPYAAEAILVGPYYLPEAQSYAMLMSIALRCGATTSPTSLQRSSCRSWSARNSY